MPLYLLLAAPLLAAVIALMPSRHARATGRVSVWLSLLPIGAAGWLWREVARGAPVSAAGDLLRADALSVLLISCVTVVAALAAWLGPGGWGREDLEARQIRRFVIFSNLFALTMLAAVVSNNVGLMWVAIEGTTIVSAVLIPLRLGKSSVEA